VAALNPGSYSEGIYGDLSKSPPPAPPLPPNATRMQRMMARREHGVDWVSRIQLDGEVTGLFADYHYVGTGDIGGAVDEESVKLLEAMVTQGEAQLPGPDGQPSGPEVKMGDGPVKVISATADQMFNAIPPEMQGRLPRYKGDLELINHSAGSLTSEAYHKRWNRRNEILADEAEKASIAAEWMGGLKYPKQRLRDAWTLVMGGQFHDTGAGTATPRAYEFAQNDDVIAMNQFAGIVESATRVVASAMDTQGAGVPVVIYNPLNVAREDVVEAEVKFPGQAPGGVKVTGPDGHTVPAQMENGKVLFLAKAPPVGYAVYFAEPGKAEKGTGELKVTPASLENARYRLTLDANGDVSSIFDKQLDKELLAAPVRLAISTDAPRQWPAWNMDFDQEQAAPRAYVTGPATAKIVESGPVRVALEVSRQAEGSTFVSTVRLAAGDAGNRVEFHESIDWRGLKSNVKAVFPLTASNRMATYNWDVGTIERPTAYERQFEVASHQWIDLTDASGSYGATILTGEKNGSDKRDDHTIRLTLMRTPGAREGARPSYSDQYNQDWGHHEMTFGLAGHKGGWGERGTEWEAYRLETPPIAFQTEKHAGKLGKEFTLVSVGDPAVRMLALKRAEDSDEVVVRLVEMHGRRANNVRVKFAGPIAEAREVNGQEQPIGGATIEQGELLTTFAPYQPRTFALKLGAAPARATAVESKAVGLNFDVAASSNDDTKTVGGFDEKGNALPAEMLPREIDFHGVKFELAPAGTGKMDAVAAKGQRIALPEGDYNTVYVLAAAADGDQAAVFRVGKKTERVTVEDWGGFIGQWDTRVWKPAPDKVPVRRFRGPGMAPEVVQVALRKDWAVSANHATWDLKDRGSPDWSPSYPQDYLGLRPGYVKPAELAWYCSHHHTADGLNEPYEYSYLFAYSFPLSKGAKELTLPDNARIRVLAVSVGRMGPAVRPAQPLYDTLGRTAPGEMEPAK
jgi:alpha-mannosidase